MPRELLEFSSHGILLYFVFLRISSVLMPDDSRCSGTILVALGTGHRMIPLIRLCIYCGNRMTIIRSEYRIKP